MPLPMAYDELTSQRCRPLALPLHEQPGQKQCSGLVLLDTGNAGVVVCMTSNRNLNQLPDVFDNGLLASAALDRLTHHYQTVIIRAASYRQKGHRKGEPVMLESSS